MAEAEEYVDLGSLLRPGARGADAACCSLCSSTRVTHISLELEDGSQVDFTNCLDCEHRVWNQGSEVLSVERVLNKARRSAAAS